MTTQDLPIARLLKVEAVERPSSGAYWALTIVCPHCRQQHNHGGGLTTEPPTLGGRVPHCRDGSPRQYVIAWCAK